MPYLANEIREAHATAKRVVQLRNRLARDNAMLQRKALLVHDAALGATKTLAPECEGDNEAARAHMLASQKMATAEQVRAALKVIAPTLQRDGEESQAGKVRKAIVEVF